MCSSDLKGRVLLIYGLQDPLVPPEDLEAIREAVERIGGPQGADRVALRTWAAGHGFLCEARADFQPEEAREAWGAIGDFLATSLTAPPGS